MKPRYLVAFCLLTLPALASFDLKKLMSAGPQCKRELLRSFGLEGNTVPAANKLNMCPHVVNSCCTKFDQVTLFENWEFGHEHSNLRRRFNYLQQIYTYTTNITFHANSLANKTLDHFATTTVNNCKVLAKRLTQYQIEKVGPKLRFAIQQMYDWWEKVFSGVNCAVCDADMHKYFDFKRNEITYSVKFCRNLVMKNLPPLLFLAGHLPKLINLVIQFTASCDAKGNFQEDAYGLGDLIEIDRAYKEKLERCRDNRNSLDWFEYCEFICEEFNLIEFSKDFEPLVDKYQKSNELIFEYLKAYEGINDHEKGNLSNHTRVLADEPQNQQNAKEEEEEGGSGSEQSMKIHLPEVQKPFDFWKLPSIKRDNITDIRIVIPSSDKGNYNFELFDSVWDENGLDLEDIGEKSMLTFAKYDKLYGEKRALMASAAIARFTQAVMLLAVVVFTS